MALLLVAGDNWVRHSGRSPEWWDSWVIMLWVCFQALERGHTSLYRSTSQGIVNAFTEHHGGEWSMKDMQHTYVILCLSRSLPLTQRKCIGSGLVGRRCIRHLPRP